MACVRVKALVDKERNRVIFAECEDDFVDILFSFLTMPMGTIIRLTRDQSLQIGSLNNLYQSVENLDLIRFRTEACKSMLLNPRNCSADHCKHLKLNIDDTEPLKYFCCNSFNCTVSGHKLLSHYRTAICGCGSTMSSEKTLTQPKRIVSDARDRAAFLRGLARFTVTDRLRVVASSVSSNFSMLCNLQVLDSSAVEEKAFDIGADQVLSLLKCSLVSQTPLTETLLEHNSEGIPVKQDFNYKNLIKSEAQEEESSDDNKKIRVKLLVSKSGKRVCCAEAGEDFIDLLFSFLAVPLGRVLKDMQGKPFIGCIDHLYKSVQDLDTQQYFKSVDHKAMLVDPKLAPGFRYTNQPLCIEEGVHGPYYYAKAGQTKSGFYYSVDMLTSDKKLIPYPRSEEVAVLSAMDPKSLYKEAASGGGFVLGPTMFTITDDLIVTPMSLISTMNVFNKLKVRTSDIEERTVLVGEEEASRLLVASFVSESALTDTFIPKEGRQMLMVDDY